MIVIFKQRYVTHEPECLSPTWRS